MNHGPLTPASKVHEVRNQSTAASVLIAVVLGFTLPDSFSEVEAESIPKFPEQWKEPLVEYQKAADLNIRFPEVYPPEGHSSDFGPAVRRRLEERNWEFAIHLLQILDPENAASLYAYFVIFNRAGDMEGASIPQIVRLIDEGARFSDRYSEWTNTQENRRHRRRYAYPSIQLGKVRSVLVNRVQREHTDPVPVGPFMQTHEWQRKWMISILEDGLSEGIDPSQDVEVREALDILNTLENE